MFISYAKLAYFKLFLTLFFMMCTESTGEENARVEGGVLGSFGWLRVRRCGGRTPGPEIRARESFSRRS